PSPCGVAEVTLRAAAGVEPSPKAQRVREFLRGQSAVSPVLGLDLEREPCIVLDLSVSSPLVAGDPADNVERKLTERVFGEMTAATVGVGIGRGKQPPQLVLP